MFELVKKLSSAVSNAAAGKAWLFMDTTTGGPAIKDEVGAVMQVAPRVLIHFRVAGALAAGAAKDTRRAPFKCKITAVRASLWTAQAADGGGGILTVNIKESGVSIFSTKITIDNTENTSVTASIPAVISDSVMADDAEVTLDVDQIGDGSAANLDVVLIGYPVE